jgi:HSP20 family protein
MDSHYTHTHTHTCPAGIERSPKMDVVESGVNYVLKIEIPGVNVSDIRVEIHGQK